MSFIIVHGGHLIGFTEIDDDSMRDSNRIPGIITLLEVAWEQAPDLRLSQLVCAIAGRIDPFDVEDDVFTNNLKKWIYDRAMSEGTKE